MRRRLLVIVCVFAFAAVVPLVADIVDDVRAAASRGDFTRASTLLQRERTSHGETPDTLLAESWIARDALALKRYDQATSAAKDTYTRVRAAIKTHPLGPDPEAPVALALGASIEVQAQAMAAQGARGDALAYLAHEFDLYKGTSIRARIQKNINMLGLEGKPAPALRGVTIPPGKPTLIFFWAHWCTDCRAEAPILTKLRGEFGSRVAFVGPTQKYGYVIKGDNAPASAELRQIEDVRGRFYAQLVPAPAVVNEENFAAWGVSTVPTIAMIDKTGKIAKFHPGQMTESELRSSLTALAR